VIEPDLNGLGSGAKTSYRYLVTGEVASITDHFSHLTTLTYDARGLWTSMNNPDTGLIEQAYDKNGNLIKRIEPNHRAVNTAIEYHYEKNRLFCVDYPTKQDVSYQYGAASLATEGNTTQGLAGRLVAVTDETGTQSFLYGALGEVRQSTRNLNESMFPTAQAALQNQTMKMAYDNFGRVLSMKYPDGEELRYSYNPAGDLSGMLGVYGPGVTGVLPAPQDYLNDIHYDKFGNQVSVTYGNGVKTSKSFDYRRMRVSTVTTAKGNAGAAGAGTKLSELSYKYDGVGNPVQLDSNMGAPSGSSDLRAGGGSWKFTYDAADRLTTASACQSTKSNESSSYSQSFSYDLIHNLRSKTRSHQLRTGSNCGGALLDQPKENNFDFNYSYDPAKPHQVTQLLSANGDQVKMSYDKSGNLLQKGEQLFVWDESNRMSRANVAGTSNDLRNFYDASGTRVFKNSSQFGTTLFVNQYFDVSIKGSNKNATKHFFAGATRIASESITFNPSTNGSATAGGEKGRTFFFHQDHLGSTTHLTDIAGDPVEYLQYFADGDVWIHKSLSNEPLNGYTFSGQPFDPETGLQDFGARFYDPKTSLWLGIDPAFSENPHASLGNSMILSAYAYASWNSIARIDPDGRQDLPASQPASSSLPSPASKPTLDPYRDPLVVSKIRYAWYMTKKSNRRAVTGSIGKANPLKERKGYETGFVVYSNGTDFITSDLIVSKNNNGTLPIPDSYFTSRQKFDCTENCEYFPVAIFHTHPGGSLNFSIEDRTRSESKDVPIYIITDRILIKFTPNIRGNDIEGISGKIISKDYNKLNYSDDIYGDAETWNNINSTEKTRWKKWREKRKSLKGNKN
jgi:RHS repeat-associated protein